MSLSLAGTPATTNAAIASYDTEVKLAYQGSSVLRPRVRVKTGIVGNSHSFQKMGSGVATQHTSHELITPADYSHTKVAATLSNWRIGDYTDLFDQARTRRSTPTSSVVRSATWSRRRPAATTRSSSTRSASRVRSPRRKSRARTTSR
jgi:hypothetical protein